MTDHHDETPPAGGEDDAPEPVSDEQLEQLAEEDDGPDVTELDDDPAYNPDDEGLKGIKGG